LYVSNIIECIKFAIRFGEYNIIISNKEITTYPLKENWIQDIIEECDRYIMQKVFEEQHYLLDIRSIKYIETNGIKFLVYQEFIINYAILYLL